MSIRLFYDLETTGIDPRKHSIHQIAGIVEVEGMVMEEFDMRVAPHPKALIDERAMRVGGVSAEQVRGYPAREQVYGELCELLDQYVSRTDKTDKIHLVGYNNRSFDDDFLRVWFDQFYRGVFGCFFWPDTIDVMVLASDFMQDMRGRMPSFKLHRVAREVGISVEKDRIHDAGYDVGLTREIYYLLK